MNRNAYFNKLFFVLIIPLFITASINAQNCAQADGSIWVTNVNDEGAGSLRAAIECANTTAGANTIKFNIPTSVDHTIFIGSTSGQALPAITDDETIIDGTTQNGFGLNGNFSPKIILDGSQNDWFTPINAIWFLRSDNSAVYGLEIRNFPDDGIDVYSSDNVIIGAPTKGNIIYSNGLELDVFPDPNSGQGPWEGCGIILRTGTSNCTIQGNIIGTNRFFTLGLGNEYCGILCRSSSNNNKIGGANPGEANIIIDNAVAIRVDNSFACEITQNAMYCNDTVAIQLNNNANFNLAPPIVTAAGTTTISGTSADGNTIEVFVNDNSSCSSNLCQGSIYLGSATVTNGTWTLDAPFANNFTLNGGESITATAIDVNNNTSTFSDCISVAGVSNCTNANGEIIVFNTNDSGVGSLRAAIDCANVTPGANTIKFNIPGNGPHRILVGATTDNALPTIFDDNTTIDGTTQPGFGTNGDYRPQIIIDGSIPNWTAPINAIWIRGDFTEVYGLEVVNFPDDAIDITASTFVQIGAPNKGNVIYNNGWVQDVFPDASGSSWNGCGVVVRNGSRNCTIQANYIGTDYTQTVTDGNEYCGIIVQHGGDFNTFGGTEEGEGNIIANNKIAIRISENSFACTYRQNEIYCNDSIAIEFRSNANNFKQEPSIENITASSISGTADSLDLVEVFINDYTGCTNSPCQGKIYLGTAIATSGGNWVLNAPFTDSIVLNNGVSITATATDPIGNTSLFADCQNFGTACDISVVIDSQEDVSCDGSNGSVSFIASGGTPPYLFDIGNGFVANPNFTDLDPGVYNFNITDAFANCMISQTVVINDLGVPSLTVASIDDAACGLTNGAVSVSVAGGVGPYTYNIGNGNTSSPTFSNLAPGNYSISVTDVNDCSNTMDITINGSPALSINTINESDATCGLSNGAFDVVVTGGTAPFSYTLNTTSSNSNSFANLAAGTYTLLVEDSETCTATLNITINEISLTTISISNINDATCGEDNGSFTVNATNGATPYTYNIGNGNTNNADFTSLAPGNYTVTVTDANNCVGTENISIFDSGSPTMAFSNLVEPTCDQANGGFDVLVAGGIAPYTYDYGNGPSNDFSFTELSAGLYDVTVTDINQCMVNQTINLAGTSAATISIDNIIDATCGNANASFTTVVTGGTGSYSYDIGNGITNNPQFNNLTAGDYEITVIDNATSCASVESISIGNIAGPTATANTNDATCEMDNGELTVNVNNGTAPYTYNIGNGGVNDNVFSNLTPGNYTVSISDTNECLTTVNATINNVGVDPIANFADDANGLALSFTNTSTAASDYSWDFGDGNSSTDVNPNHNYINGGTYNVCLTANNNCGTNTICNNLTVIAPNVDLVTFNVGEIDGPSGSIVQIPVFVEHFTDMVGFQFSINLSNPDIGVFTGVSGFNLTDLNEGSFSVTSQNIICSWANLALSSSTLEDQTILFYIEMQLNGDIGDCTAITIDDNPTEVLCFQQINGNEQLVPHQVLPGEICITVPAIDLQIAGLIAKENDQTVAGVTVSCTDENDYLTNTNGDYLFDNLTNGNTYTITPMRDGDYYLGISALDISKIRQHVLFIEALDSPYKIIAADVNNSNSITAYDLYVLQRIALGLATEFPNNTSWRFIPKDFEFPNPEAPLGTDFPESITIDNLTATTLDQDFVAIKVGDVNLSAVTTVAPPITTSLNVLIDEQEISAGKEVMVDIRAKDFADIMAYQFDIDFDPTVLKFIDMTPGVLNGLNEANFNFQNSHEGQITTLWTDPVMSKQKNEIDENDILFTLRFIARTNASKLSDLFQLKSGRLNAKGFNKKGEALKITTNFVEPTTPNIETTDAFVLYQNIPNPFSSTTTIQFELAEQEAVRLQIFDLSGKQIKLIEADYETGIHAITLDHSIFPTTGVYYYQLQTKKHTSIQKMILQR